MKRFEVITIFPGLFDGFVKESLISKAIKKGLISIRTQYLRDWTTDRHQTVDGKPYGGGPGLVMRVEPIQKATKEILSLRSGRRRGEAVRSRVILFSPRGKQFTQKDAKRLAQYDQLILICGRYEGVDERVADYIADEVISVGPYVLNGGEVAAMAVIESVARLVHGFMHDADSQSKDDHAQYTKPEVVMIGGKNRSVPKVLLSGDHAKIKSWREEARN